MLRAVEHKFNSTNYVTYPTYSASTVTLGRLMRVYTGVTAADNFAGPFKTTNARPMEFSTAIPGVFPYAFRWSSTLDWIFLIDNATAAATRRCLLYTYDRSSNVFNSKGFVTLTYPVATNHTVRGFRVSIDQYTAGTVSVAGTAVTGSGTAWSDSRLAIGSRIGFGSTNAAQIETWYVVSAIGSDTSITLSSSAPTLGGGTSYVIEEIRLITANTNATATNGGLFLTKGLNFDDFAVAGTTIPAATTTDNIKAVYYLGDGAGTQVNTASCGAAFEDKTSWTMHNIYVIDSTSNPRVYKYNLRASLTSLSSGKSGAAILLSSGTQSVTGTVSQSNNGRIFTTYHGPASGIKSLYFATTTRIYRASISGITAGSSTWTSDAMVEVPPGGTSTFTLTSALSAVEGVDYLDRIVINSTGTAGARSYVSKYNTISDELDHIFLIDTKQQDQSLANSDLSPVPSISASIMSTWVEGGLAYMARVGTTAAINQLYATPIGADWEYAATTGERLITPEMPTPNVSKYNRISINHIDQIGDINYGVVLDPFRTYYRTNGISDNSGSWTLMDSSGDISGLAPAASIQVMFEFKTISNNCNAARIHDVIVTYEDETTDSHYQPSAANSDIVNKRFAWRHSTAFGGTVPTLRVRLYDAVSGGSLVDDDSVSQSGTWERSTDGGSNWVSFTTADKSNETTYIRYTPASLADNIRVRALLTQQ